MISIIIPCYNAWGTLQKLLASLYNSSFKDFEVIAVDDCSASRGIEVSGQYPIELIRLEKRSGPATARNRGAKIARGNILLFLDADVIAGKDTLGYINKRYSEDPKLQCLVGVYAPEPANPNFFTYYKALLTTCWFRGLSEYNSFETACGSIRKSVFDELNGFDENFKGADVEDYEFGYRLRQKYKLVMDTGLQVQHHFPAFKTNARNYFKRAFLWVKLYIKRKEFDQGATSLKEVLKMSPVLIFIFAPAGLFFSTHAFAGIAFAGLVLYIGANASFFYLCMRKKGAFFLLYSIGVHMINSIIIFFSALLAFLLFTADPRGARR